MGELDVGVTPLDYAAPIRDRPLSYLAVASLVLAASSGFVAFLFGNFLQRWGLSKRSIWVGVISLMIAIHIAAIGLVVRAWRRFPMYRGRVFAVAGLAMVAAWWIFLVGFVALVFGVR